jgi:signal transduction histidine kinase
MKSIFIFALISMSPIAIFGNAAESDTASQISACAVSYPTTQVSGARSLPGEIIDYFGNLFYTRDFPARWKCGNWTSFHGWLYIISDLVIWLSYFMIPLILGYFLVRRKTEIMPFRSIIVLFIVFIVACGLTHLIDAAVFWWPAYRLSGLIRSITAVVSLGTVFALVRIAPQVMELKTPGVLARMVADKTSEFQKINERLQQEIKQREIAEQKLQHLYAELEAKSQGLEEMNSQLITREHEVIKSEQRIREMNIDLEKKVAERTAALHSSNQELEAFTYSVSHDLRAPLRAIDGYARILEDDYNPRLDAHGKHLIHVITRNARYMGQLIDDLLEFSRTSRAELVKTMFNTDTEVRKIFHDLMDNERNRSLEVDINRLENCRGDINMLRQIWVNLISNALKYTRKLPSAKIEIGSSVENNELIFYIRDNGVGFDMEYKDKLFGVFQRLHKKEEFEGTGVGLALVKRILDRHDGKIWAKAALNKGATFYFSLPS